MKNIFELTKDIKEMAIYQQKKTKGGPWSGTTTLPTIIIPPDDPDPSFYWSWGDFSFNDTSFSFGGGGDGDTDYPTNQGDINDPHNMMDFTENYLKNNIEALKLAIDNGLDPVKGKALIDAYQKGLDILDMIKESGKNYRFDINPETDPNKKTGLGTTEYDPNTDEYVITMPVELDARSMGLLMHELEHLNQIENGELSYDQYGNPVDYDIMDEVNAYQFQEYFEKGKDFEIITPDDVLNMKDEKGNYIYELFRSLSTGNNNGGGFVIIDYSSFSRS